MSYSIQIKGSAAKSLNKLPEPVRKRLIEAIDRLAQDPHAGRILHGEFRGLRRIRVGSYRVVYNLMREQLVVLVVRIGNRKDVYR